MENSTAWLEVCWIILSVPETMVDEFGVAATRSTVIAVLVDECTCGSERLKMAQGTIDTDPMTT